MWSEPCPTSAELSRVYAFVYRQVRQESPTTDYLAFMDARAAAQYDFIIRATSRDFSGLHVLDIGCGAGSLLKIFEERGARVTGFEPDVIMACDCTLASLARRQSSTSTFSPRDWQGETWILFACHMCSNTCRTLHLS